LIKRFALFVAEPETEECASRGVVHEEFSPGLASAGERGGAETEVRDLHGYNEG
jgi:hypothetical protein